MNTEVNKLEMTLKLLTTLKIVSVLENNDVVIVSLTDNMTSLSLSKLLSIHIITKKNYQQHLHVNSVIDTKLSKLLLPGLAVIYHLIILRKWAFKIEQNIFCLNHKPMRDYCYIIYECGKCYKIWNAKFLCKLCINPS